MLLRFPVFGSWSFIFLEEKLMILVFSFQQSPVYLEFTLDYHQILSAKMNKLHDHKKGLVILSGVPTHCV